MNNSKAIKAVLGYATIGILTHCGSDKNIGQQQSRRQLDNYLLGLKYAINAGDDQYDIRPITGQLSLNSKSSEVFQEDLHKILMSIYNSTVDGTQETAIKYIAKILGEFCEQNYNDVISVMNKISENDSGLAVKINERIYDIYRIKLDIPSCTIYPIGQWLKHFPVEKEDGRNYNSFKSFTRDLAYLRKTDSDKFSENTIDPLLSKFGKFKEFDNENDINDNDDLTKRVEYFLERCKYGILYEEQKDNLFKAFSINNDKPNLVAKLSVLLRKKDQGPGEAGPNPDNSSHKEQQDGYKMLLLRPADYKRWEALGCMSLSEKDIEELFSFWQQKGGDYSLINVSSETIEKMFTLLNKNSNSGSGRKLLKDRLFTSVFKAYVDNSKNFLSLLRTKTLERFNFGLSEVLSLLTSVPDVAFRFEQKICKSLLRNIDTLDEDLLSVIIKKVNNYDGIILDYVGNDSKKIANNLSSDSVVKGIANIAINNDIDRGKMLTLIGHLSDCSLDNELVDVIISDKKVSSINEDFVTKVVSIKDSGIVYAMINLAGNGNVIDSILSKTETNVCNLNVWEAIIDKLGGSSLGTWIDNSKSLGKFVQVNADDFLQLISDKDARLTPGQFNKVPMLSGSLKNNLHLAFDDKSIESTEKASFLELFKLQDLIPYEVGYESIFNTVFDKVTKDITLNGFVNLFQILVKNGLSTTQQLDVENKLACFLCKIKDNELIECLNKTISSADGAHVGKNFLGYCDIGANVECKEVKDIIDKLSEVNVTGSLSSDTYKLFDDSILEKAMIVAPGNMNQITLDNVVNFLLKLPYDSIKNTFEKLESKFYIKSVDSNVDVEKHLDKSINILTILNQEIKFDVGVNGGANKSSLETFLKYIATALKGIKTNTEHAVLRKFMSFFNSSVNNYTYEDTGDYKNLDYGEMLDTLEVDGSKLWEVENFKNNEDNIMLAFLESLGDKKVSKGKMGDIITVIDATNLIEHFDIKKIWELFNSKTKSETTYDQLKELLKTMMEKHLAASNANKRVFKEFSLCDSSLDENLVKCFIHNLLDKAKDDGATAGEVREAVAKRFFEYLNKFVKKASNSGECATEQVVKALLTYPGDLENGKVSYVVGGQRDKAKLIYCILRGICLGRKDSSGGFLAGAFYNRGDWDSVCNFTRNLVVNSDFITRIKAAIKAGAPDKYMASICQFLHGLLGRTDLCLANNGTYCVNNCVFSWGNNANINILRDDEILPGVEDSDNAKGAAARYWQVFALGRKAIQTGQVDQGAVGEDIDGGKIYGNTLFSSDVSLLKRVLNLLYKHDSNEDNEMIDVRMLFMASYFAQPKPSVDKVNGWTNENWFTLVNNIVPMNSFKGGDAACPYLVQVALFNKNKYRVDDKLFKDNIRDSNDIKIFKIYAASCEFCGRNDATSMRALGLLFSLSENTSLCDGLFNEIVSANKEGYLGYCRNEIDYVLNALRYQGEKVPTGVVYKNLCKNDTLARILIKFCYYFSEGRFNSANRDPYLERSIDLLEKIGYLEYNVGGYSSEYDFGKAIVNIINVRPGNRLNVWGTRPTLKSDDLIMLNRKSLGLGGNDGKDEVDAGAAGNLGVNLGISPLAAAMKHLQFTRPGQGNFKLKGIA